MDIDEKSSTSKERNTISRMKSHDMASEHTNRTTQASIIHISSFEC
jgi:hypothetical protein